MNADKRRTFFNSIYLFTPSSNTKHLVLLYINNPTQKPPSSFHFLINSLLKYTVLNVIIIVVGY